MVSDALLAAGALLVCAGLGLVVPKRALMLYRMTRGRTPNPDAHSPTRIRVVSALVFLVGLLGAARVLL